MAGGGSSGRVHSSTAKFGQRSTLCGGGYSQTLSPAALLSEATRSHFGRLNVLVNNAGMSPMSARTFWTPLKIASTKYWPPIFRGPYFLTQTVAKWMIEQRGSGAAFWGCVINISSVSADVASTNRGEYCISKAGVAMATKLWGCAVGRD